MISFYLSCMLAQMRKTGNIHFFVEGRSLQQVGTKVSSPVRREGSPFRPQAIEQPDLRREGAGAQKGSPVPNGGSNRRFMIQDLERNLQQIRQLLLQVSSPLLRR